MKLPSLLPVGLLTLAAALPSWAQTGTGTPGPAVNSPQNRPMPQKILLPSGGDQTGKVTTDKPRYAPGQPVALAFTITNPTKKPAVYNFSTGQQFDFSVVGPKGAKVWTWSQGRMFTQALSRLTFAPGEKRVFRAVWNGRDAQGKPVTPGVYTVNARLTSNNGPAITGSLVVNTDTDPTNMGMPTRTPGETGAIRQVDVMPPVTASARILIQSPTPSR